MRRRDLLGRLAAGAAVLALGPGCSQVPGLGEAVPTIEVELSDEFVRRVTAEGYLEAVEATPLTAPPDAQRPMKIAWVAEDGSKVVEGDVVVRFDNSEMQRALRDSQDDVSAAKEKMRKETVDSRTARDKRDRTAALADAEKSTASEFQSDDEDILSRNEIIEGQIDVELAEAKADHAHRVKAVEKAVSRSKLDLIEIEKAKSAAELQRAQDGLEKLEIKAPHPGILVLKRDWRGNPIRVGDQVWRGQKVAEIPLVEQMQVELFVLEADAGDVKEGLEAEVVIEAHPEVTFKAKVKRVDALAKPIHHEVPVQYFAVTLELETTDEDKMRIGQRAHGTILLQQGESIVVPRQAVFEKEGRTFVYRKTTTDFDEVDVTLGASSAGRVVIATGIEAGDELALRDPTKKADELLPGKGDEPEVKAGPGVGGPS
jgi:multidrug efflux pump subunit AcrA (membrane-fusion protein)